MTSVGLILKAAIFPSFPSRKTFPRSEFKKGLCFEPLETLHEAPKESHANSSKHIPNSTPVNPNEEPVVAVIGVGYVGAHLIGSFSSKYKVLGYDISEDRVREIQKDYVHNGRVSFTSTAQDLRAATHFLISVPTLLRPDKTIDSSYLQSAVETVEIYGRPGSTVVVESSVAVGMTRQILGPVGEAKNFFMGMSPEVGISFPTSKINTQTDHVHTES